MPDYQESDKILATLANGRKLTVFVNKPLENIIDHKMIFK